MSPAPAAGSVSLDRSRDHHLLVRLSGLWRIGHSSPSPAMLSDELEQAQEIREVHLDGADIQGWDSSLLTFLIHVETLCRQKGLVLKTDDLPQGVRKLLALAAAVPEKKDARRGEKRPSWLARLGTAAGAAPASTLRVTAFIGEAVMALARLIRGKARLRASDVWTYLQECGPEALPIISLISVLIGLVLAFVGAIQLKLFGAEIFVANLVGVGMAREMGAMMAAIILAGRTGAAYAAQIGTMQVNEEIDALVTLGISPMEFLVLPRMIALGLMMPLLCVYADLMGILGGAGVAVFMLDISPAAYFHQTRTSVDLVHFGVGVIKSVFFGMIVAFCGCMKGMECGRSAASVGLAATSAVVLAIVLIIVTDSLFTVLFNILNI